MYAPAYSQVLLVNKPDTDDEKRLVLDYRALNECVGHLNRPLPITHMMERTYWGGFKAKEICEVRHDQGILAARARSDGAPGDSLYHLDGYIRV